MGNDDLFQHRDDAATPLTAEERRDLKPSHISFKHELNEAEQANIARAQRWVIARGARVDILNETFVLELHRRMLKDVWKWAGTLLVPESDYRPVSQDPGPPLGHSFVSHLFAEPCFVHRGFQLALIRCGRRFTA